MASRKGMNGQGVAASPRPLRAIDRERREKECRRGDAVQTERKRENRNDGDAKREREIERRKRKKKRRAKEAVEE